ncbi:hypothetical protein ES332_A02G110400v1 [Gossypium tomentosum]|uniref:Bromo domain-containing protein n=1 Tax=Gossypium tomentosum TaxID=34277 RepID=A0A5D2RHN3_GOSTO|nr:hypothetical protein ES332_A02G110400v1 [Gossypium tomentosum]
MVMMMMMTMTSANRRSISYCSASILLVIIIIIRFLRLTIRPPAVPIRTRMVAIPRHPSSDEKLPPSVQDLIKWEKKYPKLRTHFMGHRWSLAPRHLCQTKSCCCSFLTGFKRRTLTGFSLSQLISKSFLITVTFVANPMDFSTVRKKLDGGAYTTLEQFEKDVFLICSNAILYNAPDTVYFRQARSMQELAKKDFENLRQDSDEGEPQLKVVRRGRPPGKSLKKSLESLSSDRVGSEFSSDAALASGTDASGLPNTYNLRKGLGLQKHQPADTLTRPSLGSHSKENYANCSSEWENEFPASVVKAVMKYGMKHFAVDENRRDTYNYSLNSGHEQPIFSTLNGELKQLIPVGLIAENGYVTSLARFAADLGPVVWKTASRKIDSVLPSKVKFGPGWVEENRSIEQPQCLFSGKQRSSNSTSGNHSSIHLALANSGSSSIAASRSPLLCNEDIKTIGLSSQKDLTCAPSHQFQQRPSLHLGIDGSLSGFGIGYAPQMGLALQPMNSFCGNTPNSSAMCTMHASNFVSKETKAADNSVGLHSRNAMVSHPDLALQL